ncbi:MAG TPA: methyltransferase domain-containing protein [Anaerolineaceae bacterium]|mgnify:CR=1 FL=1|nr:methyltransferase domain-containing protein [Anaerolineaceae bacterium]
MRAKSSSDGSARLFDRIAPIYGRTFGYQYKNYLEIYQRQPIKEILADCHSILDVGCGTGAMASALRDRGYQVTGVDASLGMLRQAKNLISPNTTSCVLSDVNSGLPFFAKGFDVCLASYVAHGLKPPQRLALYAEMRRLAGSLVIIHDYNDKRSLITSIAEWGEGGDYFNFIKVVQGELRDFFGNLQVIPVEPRAALYICRV